MRRSGLTLIEMLVGATILAITIVTLLDVFLRQATLNVYSRGLFSAMNDAGRVMERLRQQNSGSGCAAPSVAAPTGFASWDAWLADTSALGGGGKGFPALAGNEELVVLSASGSDPIQLTVAVCWRDRQRVLGECAWNGTQLVTSDADGNGTITSPAMLSSLITCRRS